MKAGFMALADMLTGPGVFGPRTEQAVRKFQESVGLVPTTGVAGPTTMAALTSGGRFVSSPQYAAVVGGESSQDLSAANLNEVAQAGRPSQTLTDDVTEGSVTEAVTDGTDPMLEAPDPFD